jgi:hypothetical protein
MAIKVCERCKRETIKTETCDYCSRKICLDCEKATQRIQKLTRLVICKDCWGIMPRRSAYKNRHTMAQEAAAVAAEAAKAF